MSLIHANNPVTGEPQTLCALKDTGDRIAGRGERVNCPDCRVVVNFCQTFDRNYRERADAYILREAMKQIHALRLEDDMNTRVIVADASDNVIFYQGRDTVVLNQAECQKLYEWLGNALQVNGSGGQ